MITKRNREFPATRLAEIEQERAVLLDLLQESKERKEKFADNSPIKAKPEEIDRMFCDVENPCTPTLTLDTNLYMNEKALFQKAEDVAMDVLFCSPEDCEKTLDMTNIKDVRLKPATFSPEIDIMFGPKLEEEIPPTFYQKVRKYLGDIWRQKISMSQPS